MPLHWCIVYLLWIIRYFVTFCKTIEAKLLKLRDSCVVKNVLVQHFSIHMEQNLINDDLIRQLCASHDRALSQQQFVNTELLTPGVCVTLYCSHLSTSSLLWGRQLASTQLLNYSCLHFDTDSISLHSLPLIFLSQPHHMSQFSHLRLCLPLLPSNLITVTLMYFIDKEIHVWWICWKLK